MAAERRYRERRSNRLFMLGAAPARPRNPADDQRNSPQRIRHELRRASFGRPVDSSARPLGRLHQSDIGPTWRESLERGYFDGLFLADVLGVYDVYGGGPEPSIATPSRSRSTTRCW